LYSLIYLVESLAFTKWMQDCFSGIMIAGFCQSGAAAIINVLQSKLGRAILVSGSSAINELPEGSGNSQLIGVP
jgi:hypothetical protein